MSESFSIIPSPFDNLPEDHPIVFISYSWDSIEHKAWVKKLSNDLRTKYSVYTLLDQNNRGGFDLIAFMTKAIQKADRVLMIGTPEYKRKSELYDRGGVKYEDQLISNELYHRVGVSKFIPILRAGKFDTAFASIIETRNGYDMVDDAKYEDILMQLAADLWNNPMNAAPALGPKPTFYKNDNSPDIVMTEVADLTDEEFVKEVKRLLSIPNSEITYTELIEGEGKKAHDVVVSHAQYNFEINSAIFNNYVYIHLNAVKKLLHASIVIVRYGTKKQQEILIDVMTRLCMNPYNGESSVVGTSNLHLLASTFLFHSIGLACVKFGYYQILPLMMSKRVPAGNVFSHRESFPLAHLAGVNHWTHDLLNIYMDSSWYYPFSVLVSKNLKPFFNDYFLNDDEYNQYFAIWEHLFSLMYVYYQCYLVPDQDYFPLGLFLSEDNYRRTIIGGDSYSEFFYAAIKLKNDWEPLKQGLFDGDYSNYNDVYNRGEDFYNRHRRF